MIDVIVNTPPSSEFDYPKLRQAKDSNLVVLFTGLRKGTIVCTDGNFPNVGNYSETWDMGGFEDFRGTVQLTNKAKEI